MKNLKTTFTALVMMFVIAFGTTFANAGIIIAGAKEEPVSCKSTKSVVDHGIIIAYTGIIIAYTGIIIAVKGDTAPCQSAPVEKGIIIAG